MKTAELKHKTDFQPKGDCFLQKITQAPINLAATLLVVLVIF